MEWGKKAKIQSEKWSYSVYRSEVSLFHAQGKGAGYQKNEMRPACKRIVQRYGVHLQERNQIRQNKTPEKH